jgi:magnesium chelatase family protein
MVSRVRTVAFQGIEAVPVDVQVMIAPGQAGMQIVGLPDKAVAREPRARAGGALTPPAVDAGEEGDGQPGAGRPAQGRQPLRPADRARPDGGARRHSRATRWPAMWCSANSGSTAPSRRWPGALPAAIGANADGKG